MNLSKNIYFSSTVRRQTPFFVSSVSIHVATMAAIGVICPSSEIDYQTYEQIEVIVLDSSEERLEQEGSLTWIPSPAITDNGRTAVREAQASSKQNKTNKKEASKSEREAESVDSSNHRNQLRHIQNNNAQRDVRARWRRESLALSRDQRPIVVKQERVPDKIKTGQKNELKEKNELVSTPGNRLDRNRAFGASIEEQKEEAMELEEDNSKGPIRHHSDPQHEKVRITRNDLPPASHQSRRTAVLYERPSRRSPFLIGRRASFTAPGVEELSGTKEHIFHEYIVMLHQDYIHPVFADEYLVSLNELPERSPLNDWHLNTYVELAILPTGEVDEVRVVTPSGVPSFDSAAVNAILSAAPFPETPSAIRSWNDLTYIRWGFYRNNRKCGLMNVEPFIVRKQKTYREINARNLR